MNMTIREVTMHFFNTYFRTDEPPAAFVSSIIFEHRPFLVSMVFTTFDGGKGILSCIIKRDKSGDSLFSPAALTQTSFALSYDEMRAYNSDQSQLFRKKLDQALELIIHEQMVGGDDQKKEEGHGN